MKIEKILIIIALLALFVFSSAQEAGCGTSDASRTGIDFVLISRPNFLNMGSLLQQGDIFYVGVKIENYDLEERTGTICIRDDIDDSFAGIRSSGFGECQPFVVRAGEREESSGGFLGLTGSSGGISPGTVEIFFPQQTEYFYNGMPEMARPYTANLFVSLQYNEMTQATATVTSPGTEQPVMGQDPAAVRVSATKTIHPRTDGYKLDLDIDLIKQTVGQIFLPDFSRGNFTQFHISLIPLTLQCTVSGDPIEGGVIELEDIRKVKCSTTIFNRQEQSFPLVVSLAYGVQLEKKFGFNIKTERD
ncbi:MAG: hypothetical protein JSW08_00980 [archaeon]|nr:MAG: hypothetical protein JSW08_00980 [archaeon]